MGSKHGYDKIFLLEDSTIAATLKFVRCTIKNHISTSTNGQSHNFFHSLCWQLGGQRGGRHWPVVILPEAKIFLLEDSAISATWIFVTCTIKNSINSSTNGLSHRVHSPCWNLGDQRGGKHWPANILPGAEIFLLADSANAAR